METKINIELETIASRIESICKLQGITVAKMLEECGLKKNVIANIKNGSEPSLLKIYKIARRLDVSVDYIITGKDKENEGVDIASAVFGHSDGVTISMVEDVLKYAKMVELYETVNRAKQSGGVTAIAIEPYESIHDPRLEKIRKEQREANKGCVVEFVQDIDLSDVDLDKIKNKPVGV